MLSRGGSRRYFSCARHRRRGVGFSYYPRFSPPPRAYAQTEEEPRRRTEREREALFWSRADVRASKCVLSKVKRLSYTISHWPTHLRTSPPVRCRYSPVCVDIRLEQRLRNSFGGFFKIKISSCFVGNGLISLQNARFTYYLPFKREFQTLLQNYYVSE